MEPTKPTVSRKLAGQIKSVAQLDVDAVRAYTQAIDGIDAVHSDIKNQLTLFRGDHERHIAELGAALTAAGHKAPEIKRDAKGFFIEGMTAIRAAIGTKQALKAMRQNEGLTNRKYDEALGYQGLTEELREILVRGRDDERRHLEYIELAIERLESSGAGARP
jgi:demethoxyubiquinone hydroxylase (CLK1/Coq7/Cat5 family)